MKFSKAYTGLIIVSLLLPTFVHAAVASRIVTGSVIANRTVTLSSRIMGRITQVHATEGEKVKNGQVIVEIDDTNYQAQLRGLKAAMERAEADLAHRKRTRIRFETLKKTNVVPQEKLDLAIYQLEVARANLKAAQAEIDAIKSTLAETRIKVPFDAVVINKFAETGLVTQPGQALYEIQDQNQLKFRARIKERDLAHIKLHDHAMITISAFDSGPVKASVIKIIPNGDARHTFVIELSLPDKSGLYPGMFGKAIFE